VLSTYLAEGLPYSLVHQVVGQQYLTAIGTSAASLGLASLLHLPWNLKFLWSPLVDRRGTARMWHVSTLVVCAAVVGVLAFAVATGDLRLVTIGLVVLAFAAATNDIAIDTYYMRALDSQAQSAMSGPRIAAYRVALLLGNGALVTYAGVRGFSHALGLAAALLAATAVAHALLLPRRESVDAAPAAGGGLAIVRAFLDKPKVALAIAFLLTFRAGDALMFAMNSKLLASLGLDTAARGVVNGGFGTAASIAGSMLGGLWVARRTLERSLFPIAALQSVAILLYVGLAAFRPSLPVIAACVVTEQLVAGIGTSAFVVFILRLCDGPHKATHFSFATAVMSLAGTVAGSASGFLLEAVGYPLFFALAFVASLPGVVLARRLAPQSAVK
jgi:PAT family beta-lactamase induction signal transducer AmpG